MKEEEVSMLRVSNIKLNIDDNKSKIKSSLLKKLKIKETDLIFFQSGYTFTGIHPYENMHRKIVENFPYNKIVFLPQTVKFKNQKILENVQNFYGKYDNIYFFARDKISYDIYKMGYSLF